MLGLILGLALAATPTTGSTTKSAPTELPTTIPGVIMVDGYGEVKALPDRVVLDVGLYSVEKDLLDAFEANNKVSNDATQLLYGLKIPKENIVVTNIVIQPEFEDIEQTKFKRFRIWRNLSVIIDDMQLAGKALDALLNSGASDVQMRRIYVKESEKKSAEAWKSALANTARHAQEYANKLGANISRLEWASDSPSAYSIYRTRRSVILGKLREEASAARDLATLTESEKTLERYLDDGKDMDAEYAADEITMSMGASGGGMNAPAKPSMKYRDKSKKVSKESAQTTSSFSVQEQTFSSRFLANLVVSPARRPGLGEEGMVFTSGTGVARMRLDRANLICRLYSVDKELAGAYSDNDAILLHATNELAKLGVKEADVITTSISITPEYQNENTGRIRRYRIVRNLKIQLDPLQVGEACAALVRGGVSDIDGLSYELADKKALEEKARLIALKDARSKASQVAEAFGQNLGSLEWSSENPANYSAYLFGKSNPAISYPSVQIELNEMVAYVTVHTHYTTYPNR